MTKHLRIFALILCLLFAVSPAWAANNWAGSNADAVWSLDDDSGLVLTDSVGGNDLTDLNTTGQDTVDYKEGNGCADFDSGSDEVLYRADAGLDAGFPGKNGSGEQDYSICFWVQIEDLPSSGAYDYGCVSKSKSTDGDHAYVITVDDANDQVRFLSGDNSNNHDDLHFGTALVAGIWYHVGATFTASNNARKLRIWDDNAGSLLGANASDTSTYDLTPNAKAFALGRGFSDTNYDLNGQIDEPVIFAGEALSDADIDAIRAGTYGAAAGGFFPLINGGPTGHRGLVH